MRQIHQNSETSVAYMQSGQPLLELHQQQKPSLSSTCAGQGASATNFRPRSLCARRTGKGQLDDWNVCSCHCQQVGTENFAYWSAVSAELTAA